MSGDGRLRAENEALRVRLAGLSEASLRISENLDLDTVLQGIGDSAASLTDAEYSAITTIDDEGRLQDLVVSGLTPEEQRELFDAVPDGWALLDYLASFEEPLRTADIAAYTRAAGFADGLLPTTFLGTRIRDRGKHIGNIFIGGKNRGLEFTQEDEDTLEMFATQAAMAVANARRYGEEQRAKADLEALINTSPVGVLVFDTQTGHVVRFNREARRILGGGVHDDQFGQLLETSRFRRMDGREIPRHELPMERAARSGETVRAEEIVIGLPDGKTVPTLVNATPIRSEEGEIVSVVAIIQDMTPLEELERLRAEFLGMVSHELRAPLTAIKGSAATVRGASVPLDPAEVRQFFRIIEEQADQMRDLINNLLDLTRIEAGNLSVAPEPTDLAFVVEQARNSFLSSGHHNTIEVDLVPSLPRVAADGQRIVQVLHNLLSNASKYSREWSTIRVTAAPEELHVAVSVIDEGIGIAEERLPRLFSKFSRYDTDAGERQISGYGLGLVISRGIVEAHGGRIWAESEGHGRGTCVTFTIPTAEAALGAATGPGAAPSGSRRAPSGLECVLLVDDDPQTLRYVRHTLADAGYTPILTGDPGEVEQLLGAEKPDLVLLDLVMPDTDGFDLLKRIPSIRDVPIIILSGRGGDQHIARAFEMGAADYVVKPFSPTELLARIRAALRRRAVSQQTVPYLTGDLMINYLDRSVTVADRPLKLTPTEYKLLFELSIDAGRVRTYDQLLERVWGEDSEGDAQRVRTTVKDLRRKLGDDARNPSYIFTESGVGYRMAAP
ncbi:MAG: ATP-binding protein [bacterium]|nr:ATP-binding protein [bacterium]